MNKPIFINEFITYGIQNYLNKLQNAKIDYSHVFEMHIIELLAKIYGEINIINPYNLRNDKEFINNLMLYGIKGKEIINLFKYFKQYERWLNSTNAYKSNVINQIESILIDMIVLKNQSAKLPLEEITFYGNYLNPQNGDLKKIHEIVSFEPDYIPNLWEKIQNNFQKTSSKNMNFVKPLLLLPEDYEKYGITIGEVKQLSNIKIAEINQRIKNNEESSTDSTTGGNTKVKPLQLVLTSGSGFVDTLVLLSVMATEIMVGLLIAFTVAGR